MFNTLILPLIKQTPSGLNIGRKNQSNINQCRRYVKKRLSSVPDGTRNNIKINSTDILRRWRIKED
jgi:hypothetical protein